MKKRISVSILVVSLLAGGQIKEAPLSYALSIPRERPYLELDFKDASRRVGTNAWMYFLDGTPRIALLQDGATWDRLDPSLQSGDSGCAIIPSSSAVWSKLKHEGTIEIEFRPGTNNRKRQALFTFGPLMTWPAVFLMHDGAFRVTIFYPTQVEPVAWSSSTRTLEPSQWHTALVSFSVSRRMVAYAIDGNKATSVLDDDFHVRNGCYETIYIGSSGAVPLMTHVVDSFGGQIRSVRIWTNHLLGE